MRVIAYHGGNGPSIPGFAESFSESEFRKLAEQNGFNPNDSIEKLINQLTYQSGYFEYFGHFEIRSQETLKLEC